MDAMSAADAPMLPPDASPAIGGGSGAAFPIAIVIAIGFMVTSFILIAYYFLVVRCWLRGGNGPGTGLLHRSRRDGDLAERVSAVFFTDYEADLPGGLDPDVVAALPVVTYRRARSKSVETLECAVCLGEFAHDERLKQLPGCAHAFHIDCIDTWLHHNVTCPLCRATVTGAGPPRPLTRDEHEASRRELRRVVAERRAAGGHGSSCRFPSSSAAAKTITRSFSMDCFVGDMGRTPPRKESEEEEAGPSSRVDSAGDRSVTNTAGPGETSGRLRRLLSSFGLGRSSRSTVLPIHLDP